MRAARGRRKRDAAPASNAADVGRLMLVSIRSLLLRAAMVSGSPEYLWMAANGDLGHYLQVSADSTEDHAWLPVNGGKPVSAKVIACGLGRGLRTVRASLLDLIRAGLLERTELSRTGQVGHPDGAIYRVRVPLKFPHTSTRPSQRQSDRPTPGPQENRHAVSDH